MVGAWEQKVSQWQQKPGMQQFLQGGTFGPGGMFQFAPPDPEVAARLQAAGIIPGGGKSQGGYGGGGGMPGPSISPQVSPSVSPRPMPGGPSPSPFPKEPPQRFKDKYRRTDMSAEDIQRAWNDEVAGLMARRGTPPPIHATAVRPGGYQYFPYPLGGWQPPPVYINGRVGGGPRPAILSPPAASGRARQEQPSVSGKHETDVKPPGGFMEKGVSYSIPLDNLLGLPGGTIGIP